MDRRHSEWRQAVARGLGRCSSAFGARPGGQRGGALIAVVALIAAILLVGGALFALGTGEADVVEYGVDNGRAFWLAEGGLERARDFLEEFHDANPAGSPVGTGVVDQPLGGGTYSFSVTDETVIPGTRTAYSVVSTGTADGVVRQVRATYDAETFAVFQWFIDSQAPDTWLVTGDFFEGPLHMNGHLRVDGDPWFGARVTAAGSYIEAPNSHPVFTAGYQVGVPVIPLPDYSEIDATLRAAAIDDGLYGGPLGAKSRYEVVLGRSGLGTLDYRTYRQGPGYSGWTTVNIDDLGGAAWFEEEVWLSGTIDGELTIGSKTQVHIVDDVLYADSTPGHGPDPGCDDLLGIVSLEDTYVAKTGPNLNDCEIHAVIMSLWRLFQVEDWNKQPARGTLTVWGGIIANQAWRIGTYDNNGVCLSGYYRNWHYDGRMASGLFPPYFPETGRFVMTFWEEVSPPAI